MKRVLKQPCLWVACGSFVLATVIAVVSSLLQPGVYAMDRLERGVNKRSAKTVLSAFTPENQEELALLGGLMMEALSSEVSEGKVNIIYSDPVEDESGRIMITAFAVINQNGECVSVDMDTMELEEINGKLYLSDF